MNRRELLRRLGVAGLAIPAAALTVGPEKAIALGLPVDALERRPDPAPADILMSIVTPGTLLQEITIITNGAASRWMADPGQEIVIAHGGVAVYVARI